MSLLQAVNVKLAERLEFECFTRISNAGEAYRAHFAIQMPSIEAMVENKIFDFAEHAIKMAKSFDLRQQDNPIAMSAKRVGQREVLYLGPQEIDDRVAIGTDNIQQCCVLVLDGYDHAGGRLVALAHVDKHTTEASLNKVFERFTSEIPPEALIYGSRDRFQSPVSDSNYNMLSKVVGQYNTSEVKEFVKDPMLSPSIVYTPKGRTLKQGLNPQKDHLQSRISQCQRSTEDDIKHHDYNPCAFMYKPLDQVVVRDSDLIVKNDQPEQMSFSAAEQLVKRYSEHGLLYDMRALDTIYYNPSLGPDLKNQAIAEHCATRLNPQVKAINEALKILKQECGGIIKSIPDVTMLYNDQKSAMIQSGVLL